MLKNAKWIASGVKVDAVPEYIRSWKAEKPVASAELMITALGVYEASINGQRVGSFVLAPGWTSYDKRLQVQSYDVTDLLREENALSVLVGKGWYSSPIPGWIDTEDKRLRAARPNALLAQLRIVYADGTEEHIVTDESWTWRESPIRFSEIYDGEHFDARFCDSKPKAVQLIEHPRDILIPQQGEEVREQERVAAKSVFRTPAGELLVDFGQEVTGYVEFTVNAHAGDTVRILHGEVLDKNGNFYNENYRSAKAEIVYTCREGEQTWHPSLTFFGFRYLKLSEFPGEPKPKDFIAIAVYSDLRQTGRIRAGSDKLNALITNIFWSQRGNYLDVPTDCPQRDERLGWTGDAQAFVKAASLNYDVEKFFTKWLADLAADQNSDGGVGSVIPNVLPGDPPGAAWGDAAVICPWQIYQTYGDPEILRRQFDSMKKWVAFIGSATTTPDLWTGGVQFGDWLGLDAPVGSYKGSSREDFIASAFYANAAALVAKAGRVLGEDVSAYDALHKRVVAAFRMAFPDYRTQTEHVLALQFGLAEDAQKTADALAAMIRADGSQMRTGFVGTPYLLHVLTEHGYAELAWDLMLREQYPSWLYPLSKGATTVWEHWDGVMENGEFWSPDMNSFNHYAYGAVIDWLYEKAAGLRHAEDRPGYAELIYEPHPDKRLGYMEAELETRHGTVRASWRYIDGNVRYELDTPVKTELLLAGKKSTLEAGHYVFWSGKS